MASMSNDAQTTGKRGPADLAAKLFKMALSNPRGSISTAGAYVRARMDLVFCRRLGIGPRLYGRCWVDGGGGVEIGDRLHMVARTVRCELGTHEGGQLIIGDGVFINYGTSISAHKLVR